MIKTEHKKLLVVEYINRLNTYLLNHLGGELSYHRLNEDRVDWLNQNICDLEHYADFIEAGLTDDEHVPSDFVSEIIKGLVKLDISTLAEEEEFVNNLKLTQIL